MNEIGQYVTADEQHPRLDYNQYRTHRVINTNAVDTELSSRDVHWELNVLRNIRCIVSDLLKPDLPHTMWVGRLDHLQKWISDFINMHERRDKYNAIWLSVPAYHDLTPKNTS